MAIFDCIRYYNEELLLTTRLEILWPYVDKFVIVEASRTDSDIPKPLLFAQNKHKFEKYADKIIHVSMDEHEHAGNRLPISMALAQRNHILKGLESAQDDDVILISDCDEIPNPKLFHNLQKLDYYYTINFVMPLYYYYLNMRVKELERSWPDLMQYGTRAIKYKDLKKTCPDNIRRCMDGLVLLNGGWHFSFLGDVDFIINKIKAYGHQEFNLPKYLNRDKIRELIDGGWDLFQRYYSFEKVPLDSSYPDYILQNQHLFKDFIR